MTNRNLAVAAAACLALAALSLWFAPEPVYDAWAWLVWGRELADLDLDLSSGPSWKPLPVLLAAVLSIAGDAAPDLWLALVRAAWLFAVVLAAHLAYRLSAGHDRRARVAGAALAALMLVLLGDAFTAWARQGAAAMSEPLLVALVLGAVAAALDGRSRLALAAAGLAALLRPETWPLLAVYALWRWRAEPALRPWIALVAVAVPALWIAPELLAGDGANAGERALRGGGAPLHELVEVFTRAAPMPLAAAWPLALFAVAARPRDRALATLGAGALAWICVVAVMAAVGFPGLPRFMAPAIAIAGVLAGVGLARLVALAGRPRPADARPPPAPGAVMARGRDPAGRPSAPGARALAAGALAAVLVACAVELPGRVVGVADALSDTAAQARSHDRLRALTASIGRDRLLRCGALATSDVLTRTALAWELGVPLGGVVSFGVVPTESGAFVVGARSSVRVRRHTWPGAERLGARGEWRAYSIDCPAAAGSERAAGARDAGVSGARR